MTGKAQFMAVQSTAFSSKGSMAVGLIIKKLPVFGDKGRTRVQILFDTGASSSFVRRDIAESLATILKLPSPEVYTLGDGVGRLRATETAVLYVIAKSLVTQRS
jgi:hypothetical protein